LPLDAICLAAVKEELRGRITGMKIDKIQQPERDIVILSLRGGGAPPCRLLLSVGGGDARLHLTEYKFDNPNSPPMFCMLLRKHLTGARIVDITQPQAERLLVFSLEAPDAMGVVSDRQLIVELIGRLSNIVLTDSDGIVTDCLRRIGGELDDKRLVLPGLMYHMPPAQTGKLDPFCVTPEQWRQLLIQAEGKTADKWLLSSFTALSPLICRELTWRAYGETDFRLDRMTDAGAALSREFCDLISQASSGGFEPWMVTDAENKPMEFSYTMIRQYENVAGLRKFETFSAMLDEYCTRSAQIARVRQRAAASAKIVKTARDRLARKIAVQQAELDKTADRDALRQCGDMITANLHLMKKGQSILTAEDFYAEGGGTRNITLDPRKTPQENAARYYKEYTKAKNAGKYLTEQLRLGFSELEYLESVLQEIDLADSAKDVEEIRDELIRTGYIKAQKQGKEKQAESAPMLFESSSGMRILAGRNNTQNDKLTLKTASRTDVWLHAQKIHGAHVIISCGDAPPDDASLYEAALIAAYYSSARSGGKVPVDYTFVKHVKKAPGGRPGMVIYSNYKTITAAPDGQTVERLRYKGGGK